MIRVLHGNDEFAVEERLTAIKDAAGPPEVRDPNTSEFEGPTGARDQIIGAAMAIPFLADRRLVIVRGLLGIIDGGGRRDPQKVRSDAARKAWEGATEELPCIPPSTDLIFIEDSLRARGPGLKLVGETAKVEQFVIPRVADLDRWIAERFARHGGAATPSAVRRLGDLVGPHTRLLDQEIGKLALYAGGRSVDVPDIDLMVAAVREGSIFPAVDAVLERRTSRAIRLMYELLEEGASVQYLMSMLTRQLRMTIVAQDMMNSRSSVDDIGKRLGLKAGSYPLRKTMEQAGKFDFDYVARAHRRLLEADVAFKTGADERLGAELLIARLAAS